MTENELQKLREVVVGRLKRGDYVEVLQGQIARRLGPEAAARLIHEARERVEADGGEVSVGAPAEALAASEERPGRYWRGPIVSAEHGARICETTAYWFGGFGVLALLPVLLSSIDSRPDISAFATTLFLVVPSAWLWKTKSVVAAGSLVALSGLSLLGAMVFGLWGLGEGDGFGVVGIILAATWTVPLMSALRAFTAARYVRRSFAMAPLDEVFS